MASSTVILGSLLVALFFPFFFLPDFLPLPDFFLGGITFAVCCRNLWSSYQKFHTTTTTIFKTDDGFGCKGLGAKGHSGEARRRNTWIRPTHIHCFKSRSNKALLSTHSLISILMKRKGLNNSFPISFKQSFYGTYFRFVSKLLAILALIRMGRGIEDTGAVGAKMSAKSTEVGSRTDTKRLESKRQTLDDAYAAPANFLEIDVINAETHGVGKKRYTDYEVRLRVRSCLILHFVMITPFSTGISWWFPVIFEDSWSQTLPLWLASQLDVLGRMCNTSHWIEWLEQQTVHDLFSI